MNDVFHRVKNAEENFVTIRKLMSAWMRTPLFERRDGKSENPLEDNGKVDKRFAEIREAGEKITSLLEVLVLYLTIKLLGNTL